MDDRECLKRYGKKNITIEELASLLSFSVTDIKNAFETVERLTKAGMIEAVKSSGKNGNLTYPLYKKYRILFADENNEEIFEKIKRLHPVLVKNGYLPSHPMVYQENRVIIEALSKYFFMENDECLVSRKERSYQIFGREKILDDSSIKALLKNIKITENDLLFYDTPEYCFHDYIPVRKEQLILLICENKDIWFNIRRCMFEDGYNSLFGTKIDGVVYGNGNKVSQKQGALSEYVKFMGNPDVTFLYWGDIDREGFDIFRRTKEINDTLNISLFLPGYKKMIEKAKNTTLEDSPSSKKEGMCFDDLFDGFDIDEIFFLNNVLAENKLIPQEIISYKFLSEG